MPGRLQVQGKQTAVSPTDLREDKGGRGEDIHCLSLREEFRPVPILELKLAQPPNQEPDIRLLRTLRTLLDRFRSSRRLGCSLDGRSWLVVPREDEVVDRFVVEQEFHPAAASTQSSRDMHERGEHRRALIILD